VTAGARFALDKIRKVKLAAAECLAVKLAMVVAGLALLVPIDAVGQERSPSDWIRFLTYQSDDRRGKPYLFQCGQVNADRAAARSLAKLGSSAIPDIERALDSLEERGARSEFSLNAGWLPLAYARIEGQAGIPRLRRLIGNPKLEGVLPRVVVDWALALALGLTSMVSDSRGYIDVVCRAEQPRDALDRLILAWEKNDRAKFVAALGPEARAQLHNAIKGSTWQAWRTNLWPRKGAKGAAVGYRFHTSGKWADPEETLGEPRDNEDLSPRTARPDLETQFTDRDGQDCGKLRVSFVNVELDSAGSPLYRVNSSDITQLLRLIGACASQAGH
jgi:hypothetical protein